MSQLKYYFDVHIPKAVARELRRRGIDVVRCQEAGLHDIGDPRHLEYATQQGRVMVTHDEDFLKLDDIWQNQGKRHAEIMRFSNDLQGNVGYLVRELVAYFELIQDGAGNLTDDIENKTFFIS